MAKKYTAEDMMVGIYRENDVELTTARLWNTRAWGGKECSRACMEDVLAAYSDAMDTERAWLNY